MHNFLFIVFFTQYPLHSILCLIYYAQHSMQNILCIAFYAQPSMHKILCIVLYVFYALPFNLNCTSVSLNTRAGGLGAVLCRPLFYLRVGPQNCSLIWWLSLTNLLFLTVGKKKKNRSGVCYIQKPFIAFVAVHSLSSSPPHKNKLADFPQPVTSY